MVTGQKLLKWSCSLFQQKCSIEFIYSFHFSSLSHNIALVVSGRTWFIDPTHTKVLKCLSQASGGDLGFQLFLFLLCSLRRSQRGTLISEADFLHPQFSPDSLPLHDVPQLAQVGLGNGVVRFELESSQVVRLRFWKLTVQVEDGAKVHQSSWTLGRKNRGNKSDGRVQTTIWHLETKAEIESVSSVLQDGEEHIWKIRLLRSCFSD